MMKPCDKCLENNWKFKYNDGYVQATCEHCGHYVEFKSRPKHNTPVNEKIICPHCHYDGDHKLCFNFDAPDLAKIDAGESITPKFRIKCICGICGKYIKFLPFKGNISKLHDKFIDY
jgi:hypothetical protein